MVAFKTAACLAGGIALTFLARPGTSFAFPFIDPTNADNLPTGAPTGTDLPATDARGLQNQLRLTNPAGAGNPGAWTIIPRLTIQEEFTDNALEVTSPRVFDAVTVVAPGINVAADTARLKLALDYQPTLLEHAVEGPLNVLTQQLNLTGLVTVVPDLAFVDVRALSGVQSRTGTLGGGGTLGAGGGNTAGTALAPANAAQAGQGLNRNNEVQTSSFGLSPYLLRDFGDYGMAKVGVSVNVSRYSTITGFAANPLPGGGTDGASLLSTEQIAHYNTGQFLQRFQDTVDVDLMQSHNTSDPVTGTNATGGITTAPGTSSTSRRATFNNQLSYALTHSLTLLASVGYEQISYSTGGFQNISEPTWNVGFTYTPSPYSTLTATYGRQNGANAAQVNGYFAIGGRSMLTVNYSNTVGTQLENLQNQFNNSALSQTGALVNAQTGGPVFVTANGLGVQSGVFRFNSFNTSFTTTFDRDTVQATASWGEQTALTPGIGFSGVSFDAAGNPILTIAPTTVIGAATDYTTFGLTWTHELSPDLTGSASGSYSFTRRSSSIGNDGSLSLAVGVQYALSQSTSLTARYSFFDRVSKIPGYSLYEDILLIGVTKRF